MNRHEARDFETGRAHRIKDEQEAHIASVSTERLILELEERLRPILTHERTASTMRVPVDYEHDDDVFVMTRLHELRRRFYTPPGSTPPPKVGTNE